MVFLDWLFGKTKLDNNEINSHTIDKNYKKTPLPRLLSLDNSFVRMENPHLLSRSRKKYDPHFLYFFHPVKLYDVTRDPWIEKWKLKLGRVEISRRCGIVGMGYPNNDGSNRWSVYFEYKDRIGDKNNISLRQLDFLHERENHADENAMAIYASEIGMLGYLSKSVSEWLHCFSYANWELGIYYKCVSRADNGYDYILMDIILRSPKLDILEDEWRVYRGSTTEEACKKRLEKIMRAKKRFKESIAKTILILDFPRHL